MKIISLCSVSQAYGCQSQQQLRLRVTGPNLFQQLLCSYYDDNIAMTLLLLTMMMMIITMMFNAV